MKTGYIIPIVSIGLRAFFAKLDDLFTLPQFTNSALLIQLIVKPTRSTDHVSLLIKITLLAVINWTFKTVPSTAGQIEPFNTFLTVENVLLIGATTGRGQTVGDGLYAAGLTDVVEHGGEHRGK